MFGVVAKGQREFLGIALLGQKKIPVHPMFVAPFAPIGPMEHVAYNSQITDQSFQPGVIPVVAITHGSIHITEPVMRHAAIGVIDKICYPSKRPSGRAPAGVDAVAKLTPRIVTPIIPTPLSMAENQTNSWPFRRCVFQRHVLNPNIEKGLGDTPRRHARLSCADRPINGPGFRTIHCLLQTEVRILIVKRRTITWLRFDTACGPIGDRLPIQFRCVRRHDRISRSLLA